MITPGFNKSNLDFDLAICVPWKCASQYVKHTLQVFREEYGLKTMEKKCELDKPDKCQNLEIHFDSPAEWSKNEILRSKTASR